MLTKLRMMKCLIIFSPIFSSSVPKAATPFCLVSNSNPTISKISSSLSIKPTMVSSNSSSSMFSIHRPCLQSKAFSSSSSSAHSGEIHVIVGPMFAGKTTTLLRRIQAEKDLGRNVAVIKSNKDTRYGLDSIVSHDGAKLPCWALPSLSLFRQKFGADAYNQLDVIGIDEAQFFEDLYEFCQEAADHDGKTLIVSGLDGDYLRRSFGSVLHIVPLADSVTKLSARCELCGRRAFFTLRKTQETQTELIGGADIYMPVCRQHYVSGQAAVEATKTVLESQMVRCGTHV